MWPSILKFLAGNVVGGAVGAGGAYGLMRLINSDRPGTFPTTSQLNRANRYAGYMDDMMGGSRLDALREIYGGGAEGIPSIATHKAASSSSSDWLVDLLRRGKKETPPSNAYQFMGDVGSFGLGLVNEAWNAPQYIWAGDDPATIWRQTKEDIGSNWKGSFGTDYGVPQQHIFKETFNEGLGQPNFGEFIRDGAPDWNPSYYTSNDWNPSYNTSNYSAPAPTVQAQVDRDDFRGL